MRKIETVSITVYLQSSGKTIRTLTITFEDGEVFTTNEPVSIADMVSDDCVPEISKTNPKKIYYALDSDKVMRLYDRLKNVKNTKMVT